MSHETEVTASDKIVYLMKPKGCGVWLELLKEQPPMLFNSKLHTWALVKANDGCDNCTFFPSSKRGIGATALTVQSARQELIRKENEKIESFCPKPRQPTT